MYNSATMILVDNENKVLLLKRHMGDRAGYSGKFCLPGGKKEGRESYPACAVRETFEETGFVVDETATDIVKIHYDKRGVIYFFTATDWTGQFKLSEEHIHSEWLHLSDIKEGLWDEFITPITLNVLKTFNETSII